MNTENIPEVQLMQYMQRIGCFDEMLIDGVAAPLLTKIKVIEYLDDFADESEFMCTIINNGSNTADLQQLNDLNFNVIFSSPVESGTTTAKLYANRAYSLFNTSNSFPDFAFVDALNLSPVGYSAIGRREFAMTISTGFNCPIL